MNKSLVVKTSFFKVWVNDREVLNLEGHTLGVWAGIVLPETGIMVTGSADKTIRLWKSGRCRKILEHHTQSVRGNFEVPISLVQIS
jgi:phospholipase A-2-activating protein